MPRPFRSPVPRARRVRRLAVVASSAGLLLTTLGTAAGAADAAPSTSPLVLRVPTTMTGSVYSDGHHSFTYIDSTLFLQATTAKFELWSHRTGYSSPITTTMHQGNRTTELPAGTTSTLAGLSDFLDVTVQDSAGNTVYDNSSTVCLNDYQPVRSLPNAAAHSDYPAVCGDNPFALGSVQGIARGWATHIDPFGSYFGRDDNLHLAVGTYHVEVSIDPKYRALFGIAAADGRGSSTLKITSEGGGGGVGAASAHNAPAALTAHSPQGVRLDQAPGNGPRPDLAALPAWGISVSNDGNYLRFGATVWNAGTSPLVVDGFRKGNANTMDAYQYFYDTKGHQTGYVRAGTMVWDPRPSHRHWHFENFARYTLLDADKKTAVISEKEAFCLADTDAIDYTLPSANWHPDNTDLQTACGDHSAIAVSEVLATGSGDTYTQIRAGQSFPLQGLANGIYYIQVQANPEDVLTELSQSNNVALRKVQIGGTDGHRTVRVFPVGDVTS